MELKLNQRAQPAANMTVVNNDDNEKPRRPFYSFNVPAEHKDKPVNEVTFSMLMTGFLECTTMHGFPSVHIAYGYFKKFVWTVISLFMLALCISNVYTVIDTYLQWGVTVSIEMNSVREITFPSVTICNVNPYRKSVLPAKFLAILNSNKISKEVHEKGPSNLGGSSGLGTVKSDYLYKEQILSELLVQDPLPTRQGYGHQFADFILGCTYEGYDCMNKNNWNQIYNYKYGNCFTFNGNINRSESKLVSHRPGPGYGLQVDMNTDQSEYLESIVDRAGARVVIHDSTEMPFPDETGIFVAPGLSTSVGLRKTDISRQGGVYGDCIDSTGSYSHMNVYEEISPWTNYSLTACQKTCFQVMTILKCDCFDSRYPPFGKAFGKSASRPCLLRNQTQATCQENVKTAYLDDSSCAQCHEPCNETLYQTSISSALWPAKSYLIPFLASLNSTSTTIEMIKNQTMNPYENLIQLEVYFEELNYERILETPTYDLSALGSNIGGAVGLWIGASLVSLYEIVELGLDSICLIIGRLCCRSNKLKKVKINARSSSKEALGYY